MLSVRQATIADLDVVAPLFDAYRRFYRAAGDLDGARRFLLDRFSHSQSVIFLAFGDDKPVGFTQLYPGFSSVSMARIFILNDLFVSPEARTRGVGAALLNAAADYGRRAGAVRLALSTELTNTTAQTVYEHNGWKRDTVFCSYNLTL
jgi:GNAT superfamily N-acetyltransferase